MSGMHFARAMVHGIRCAAAASVGVGLALAACAHTPAAANAVAPSGPTSLKDAFRGAFKIGVAVNAAQFSGRDTLGVRLIEQQFNAISPENALKWESVHPRLGEYTFAAADQYVAFGEAHHMFILGHNLVWHNQVPRWVFQSADGAPVSRDTLLARMRDHIFTVVGRYKGRINAWDVVNEALNEDGTLRQSPWLRIIGPDYIVKAFQFAHEADPGAELYYNDYSLENTPKRNGAVKLVRDLLAQGIPIAGIGLQGHDKLNWPTAEQEDSTISAFAALGIKVNISELDVDVLPAAVRGPTADISARGAMRPAVNPYPDGLPDSVQTALTRQYRDLFGVFLRHRAQMERVTFWGATDADSWLNNWPVPGRTSYPLLFDRQGRPKPAFDAIVREARAVLSPT